MRNDYFQSGSKTMNETKKKFIVLTPEEKEQKIKSINESLKGISKQLKKYEQNAENVYHSVDSSGKEITPQTILAKIQEAQMMINTICDFPMNNIRIRDEDADELNREIKKASDELISVVNKVKQEINKGNVGLVPELQKIFNQNHIKATQKEEAYDIMGKIDSINAQLDDLENYRQEFDRIDDDFQNAAVSEKEMNAIKHEVAELKRSADKVKIPSKLTRTVRLIAENFDKNEVERTLKQLDSAQVEMNKKISDINEKISSIRDSKKTMDDLMSCLLEIPKIKMMLLSVVDSNSSLKKKAPEYDPDIQRSAAKLQKEIDQTINEIRKSCGTPTSEKVNKYFKALGDEMEASAATISSIHQTTGEGLPQSLITRSFVDVQKHENDISNKVNEHSSKLHEVTKNEPINEKNIKVLLKRMNEVKQQTKIIPQMAKNLLSINDEQSSLVSDLDQANIECDGISHQVEMVKKTADSFCGKKNLESGIKAKVEYLQRKNSEIDIPDAPQDISSTLNTFKKEIDGILRRVENKINEKEAKGVPSIALDQLKANVESTIIEINENTQRIKKNINEATNSSFASVAREINQEIEKMNHFLNSDSSETEIGDAVDDFENELNELLDRCDDEVASMRLLNSQLSSIKSNEKIVITAIDQMKEDIKKKIPASATNQSAALTDELIKCVETLFLTERKMSIIAGAIVLPIHDMQKKLQALRRHFRDIDADEAFGDTTTTTTEGEGFSIPVFNWNNRPKLQRIVTKEARAKAEQEADLLKKCKDLAAALKGKIQSIDDTQFRVDRFERVRNHTNEKATTIDMSKPLKLPKGAESVPAMNWKLLKYKIMLNEINSE